MGTEKRERQKVGRQARVEAEVAAERRARARRTAVRVVIGVVAILAVLFAYSALFGGDDGDSESADDTTTTTAEETTSTTTERTYSNPELAEEVLARDAPNTAPPPEDTPADALEIETVIEGSGEGAAVGDTVVARYEGKLADGTVFDSSWDQGGEPIDVALGQGAVIPGWDEGLVGAKIGERRRLVIGSENAYGAQGAGGVIPGDAPLAFEVDIVDITPSADATG